MAPISTKVGGRELTSYCSLSPSGKVHSKENKRIGGRGRSIYLNEQMSNTVEARFFQGTTKTNKLKAYVQYLESIIKYTKYTKKTVTVKGWLGYIKKKAKKYTNLLDILGTLTDEQLSYKVVYKQPTMIKKYISNLSLSDMSKILEIATSTKTYTNIEIVDIKVREGYIYFTSKDSHKEVAIAKITSIQVEKE